MCRGDNKTEHNKVIKKFLFNLTGKGGNNWTNVFYFSKRVV